MKPACRHLLAAFTLLCSAIAVAAPYPTRDQLRGAIQTASSLLENEHLQVLILDARAERIAQPLFAAGLNLHNGICLIYYNDFPEDGLVQFFAGLRDDELRIILAAMAAHETAHCVEQREAYIWERFDKVLPPGFEPRELTVQGYLSVVKSGALETWGEALADIVSILYLQRALPDDWKHYGYKIAAMRANLAWKWPEHDTSAWLLPMIAAGVDVGAADQSLFDAALELRIRYRPVE
jgi:hypothetical protein